MKNVVVPCSGIGKALGAVTREVASQMADSKAYDQYMTICLPLLLTDDEETRKRVLESDVYTVDGCPKKCASALVKHVGGEPVIEILAAKVLAENREHKPDTVLDIGKGGRLLAEDIIDLIVADGGTE
ncbi:MAG: putative zinc-binding protein [Promethearchaeia archaeon]